jgi:hypothetical protein
LVDRSGNVGQQLRPNHFGPFLIALTESWKEDCKGYESFRESDLKRIEETASYAISIHSSSLTIGQQLKAFGLRVLHTPARALKANAYCERLVGSARREYLDFMIPLGENKSAHPVRVGYSLQQRAPSFEPRTRDS